MNRIDLNKNLILSQASDALQKLEELKSLPNEEFITSKLKKIFEKAASLEHALKRGRNLEKIDRRTQRLEQAIQKAKKILKKQATLNKPSSKPDSEKPKSDRCSQFSIPSCCQPVAIIGGGLILGHYLYPHVTSYFSQYDYPEYKSDPWEGFKYSRKTSSSFRKDRSFQTCRGYTPPSRSEFSARFSKYSETQKEKSFRIITSYTSDKPERLAMTNIVLKNQESYAKVHGYEYQPYINKGLKGCENPNFYSSGCKPKTCEPHWHKIKLIVDWLKTPNSSEKEEWILWLDDDMMVTNQNWKLEGIVDSLREGRDTSIIVTKDAQEWHGGDKAASINTGLLLVRKDPNSLAFFRELWKRRNEPFGYESTYGTCKNQSCLHEQDRMAEILYKYPDIINSVVTITPQRPSIYNSQMTQLALNTFARGDCYIDYNRNMRLDYSGDDPNGRWIQGDFASQCTGLPLWGKLCEAAHYIPTQNFRLDCVKELAEKTIAYLPES